MHKGRVHPAAGSQATFYDGIVPFYLNGTVASEDADGPVGLVDFDWNAGNGLMCMYAAATLKAVDILVLAIIPTPNITRDPVEQVITITLIS
jgi:hypothetical protein